MSELTLTIIRLGFIAVLWSFVLTAVSVIRSDLFGARLPARPAPRVSKVGKRPTKPSRGIPHKLVVTQGALAGTVVTLSNQPITIGRAPDSTIVVDDDYASSRHARLYPNSGSWLIEDLGSTNGTYLGRGKIDGPTPAPIGAPIRVGKTVFELRK